MVDMLVRKSMSGLYVQQDQIVTFTENKIFSELVITSNIWYFNKTGKLDQVMKCVVFRRGSTLNQYVKPHKLKIILVK